MPVTTVIVAYNWNASILDKLVFSRCVFTGIAENQQNFSYFLGALGSLAIFLMTIRYHWKFRKSRGKTNLIQTTIDQIYMVTIIPTIGCCLAVYHVILSSILQTIPAYDQIKQWTEKDLKQSTNFLCYLYITIQSLYICGTAVIFIADFVFGNMIDVLITLLVIQRAFIIFVGQKFKCLKMLPVELAEEPQNITYFLCALANFGVFLMTCWYCGKVQRRRGEANLIQSTIDQIYIVTIIPSIGCCLAVCHVILNQVFHHIPSYDDNILGVAVDLEFPENFVHFLFNVIYILYLLGYILLLFCCFLFSNMLDVLITLLAIQRAVIIFFGESWRFLVSKNAFRMVSAVIWCGFLLNRMVVYKKLKELQRTAEKIVNHPEIILYYNFTLALSIISTIFCTILYISLFRHLFKQRNNNRKLWEVPEIAFLYEGVPLLITRVLVSFYTYEPLTNDVVNYAKSMYNYEIRYRIISIALVQFTYIFDISTIRRGFEKIFRANSINLSPSTQI
ncbi:unnamed protein product [Caenorhabditis angaria]|uniref:Uncharacterized protein n=1 Tax=Caenorhabditis angaria TaxID=860376 RepID=A0A9P1J0Y3_9PELO|nr:unnamed protein product [Caenorhabditis angaria]